MECPDQCIRGIPNEDCLYKESLLEGNPQARLTLYPFPKERRRDDGWIEESINWMFDVKAIEFTLNQEDDDGKLQFPVGLAILPLIELNKIRRKHRIFFSYEPDPIKNNKYHGNLLLNSVIKPERKRMIRDVLAYHSEIKLQENYPLSQDD